MNSIHSGPRRRIASTNNPRRSDRNNTIPHTIARSEIDNHADTTCFGSNFTPISFTGEHCEVSPFSDEYSKMTDIPVASAATAWDDPVTGLTTILIFNQGLWFGTKLENSLINPNQCRMHGIELCDDPFDPNRALSFVDPFTETTVPMEFGHSVVYFKSRAPTMEEIRDLVQVEMTSEERWDPSTIGRKQLSREEEEHQRLIASVKIDPQTIGAERPEEPQLQFGEAEYDVLLASCSAVYSERTLIQRLIASVRVVSCYEDEEDSLMHEAAEPRKMAAVDIRARHTELSAEEVSKKFGIGIETARNTLKATTQHGIRHAMHPLSRRYRTDIMQSKRKRLNDTFYSDTMFSGIKSIRGNTCAQMFTNGKFVHLEPVVRKAQAGEALHSMIDEVGIPEMMVFDGAKEQTGPKSEFMRAIRKYRVKYWQTEPYSPWQNRAEDQIREVRRRWRLMRQRKKIPTRLWDYAMVHITKLMNMTARGRNGRTGHEEITGETPDISEYVDFDFYDWVWYWDTPDADNSPKIGRWLGPSHRIGASMCFYVLVNNGEVISRSSVQHLTQIEMMKDDIKVRLEEYDNEVQGRLRDDGYECRHEYENAFYIDDEDEGLEPEEPNDIPEIDEYTPEGYDEYIGAQMIIPRPDGRIQGKIVKRMKGNDGNPIGRRNDNPLLDTRQYEVELSDGTTEEFYANVIAENLFSQVDTEGRQYVLLKEISEHRKDETAIPISEGWLTLKNGRKVRKRTTRGWQLLIEWKEGGSDWLDLKDVKESYPVEVAEYAKANKISEEPAFAWWVNDVLRRRNRIISKVKSRYWKTTHKFGVELPHSVQEAFAIDARNGNNFWREAIEKEMSKIRGMGAFERYDKASPQELRGGDKKLPGYQQIGCHMIFDIKMDGQFTRKARFVANGNETKDLASHHTYASVVTRESVRIAFLYAALNDLKILGCDVSNAYLNAPCREKIWVDAGPEFGSDQGSVMIVRKALYGLKSSGFSWKKMLTQNLEDMGYKSSIADPDVFIRAASKPDGTEYYEFLLTYVDDCLCVSAKPEETMNVLGRIYDLKDTVKPPERYLGANIKRWQLPDGRECWAMSGKDYVKNAVNICKGMLAEDGLVLKTGKGTERPMPKTYRPELDVSPVLGTVLASRYQQLIGILRWAVELGRVDILLEVSLMSSHLCQPREGHLEALYNIFAYLSKHVESTMAFDDKRPRIDEEAFHRSDWSDSVYGDVEEELPPKMPKPLGNPVMMTCYVDANHAGDKVTRRSQTGFIIYLNNAPIDWFSKRQNTCESSTFGSEFVAMRIAIERIKALRYKLRMFGIPIDGPTNVLGDNESVVNSASKVEARLNKKHNAICFHTVREASAAKVVRVGWEPTDTNIADIFTKMLDTEQRRNLLMGIFTKGGEVAAAA